MDLYKALTEENITEQELRDIFERELQEASKRVMQDKMNAYALRLTRKDLAACLVDYSLELLTAKGYKVNYDEEQLVNETEATLIDFEKNVAYLDDASTLRLTFQLDLEDVLDKSKDEPIAKKKEDKEEEEVKKTSKCSNCGKRFITEEDIIKQFLDGLM